MSGLRARAMSTTCRNVGGPCAAAPASVPSWIHASTARPSRAGRRRRLRPLSSCCRVIRALPLFRRRTGAHSVASDVADLRAVWVPAPKRKEGNERNAAEDAMGRSLCEILRGLTLVIVDSFATLHVHCAAPRTPPGSSDDATARSPSRPRKTRLPAPVRRGAAVRVPRYHAQCRGLLAPDPPPPRAARRRPTTPHHPPPVRHRPPRAHAP